MKRSQLEILPVISQTENLRKTASILDKNPSNISRGLKSLEEDLGCCLISYREKKMIFTPEGKMVCKCSEEYLRIASLLDDYIVSLHGKASTVSSFYHNWSEKDIHYLIAIRKHGNLTKAATDLFISQPSLSQMLHRLRSYCGFDLFESENGRLVPSPESQRIFEYIDSLQEIIDQIRNNLEEFYQLRRGTVKVGLTSNIGSNLIPRIVPAFLKRYPNIRLRIRENKSPELKKLMKEGRVDFCILHEKEANFFDSSFHYPCSYEEKICLIIPQKWEKKLELPSDRPINAFDLLKLANENYVLCAKKTPLRDVIERIFLNVRLQTGNPYEPVACCSAKNTETIKRLVMAETGIAFLPESELIIYASEYSVIKYPLESSLEARWSIALALPKENRLSICSKEFIDVTKEALKDFITNENSPTF